MSDDVHYIQIIRDATKNDSRREIQYSVLKVLGEGGFGKVSYVSRTKYDFKEDREVTYYYALKTIQKQKIKEDKNLRHRVITEIKIHRQLSHPHICKFDYSFDDEENVNIVLEYCHNNSLQELINNRGQLTEFEVRYYMFQVLEVLIYLKRQKIIHRDLTLSNIFLTEDNKVKVGDFGLSFKETSEEERRGKVCGTQPYLAPEITGVIVSYSYKTDIWAFGIDIYTLLTGKILFENPEEAKEKIENGGINFSHRISEEAKSLLSQILVREQDRIDLFKIYDHPFFDGGKNLDVNMPTYLKENEQAFINSIDEFKKKITITYAKDRRLNQIKKLNENEELKPFQYNNNTNSNNKNNNMMNNGNNTNRDKPKRVSLFEPHELINKEKNGCIKAESNKTIRYNIINSNNSNSNSNNSNSNSNNNTSTCNLKKENSLSKKQSQEIKSNNSSYEKSNIRINTIGDIQPRQSESIKKQTDCNSNSEYFNNHNNNNHHCLLNSNNDLGLKISQSGLKESSFSAAISKANNQFNTTIKDYFFQSFEESKETTSAVNDIMILNYEDQSKKYGLGYRLNNGLFGVYFNDKVKIVLNSKELFYYSKDDSCEYFPFPLEYSNSCNIDLYQKYPILIVFIEELLRNEGDSSNDRELIQNEKIVYLQRWKKTKTAMFFLLSNKNIQVNFNDMTIVVFKYQNKIILYHNEHKEITQYFADPISSFYCQDKEIKDKINYAINEFLKDH